MSNEQQSVKMWSGRFREPLDSEFEAWQRSIVFDWRLLNQEIAASKAHASALIAANILSESEGVELRAALDAIAAAHSSDAGMADVCDHVAAQGIRHVVQLEVKEWTSALRLMQLPRATVLMRAWRTCAIMRRKRTFITLWS